MIDLTKTDESLLLYLALHGPTIGNRMKPKVRNASRTAKRLKRVGMIEGEYNDEYSRATDLLSLTVLGLATALLYPQVHENLRDVIKSWGSLLPLVLGKWDFFVSAGVEDLARSRLMTAAVALVRASLSPEWHFAWETPIDPDEIFRSNFYHMLEYGCLASEARLRWIEVCARDRDIRPYLIGKMAGVFVQYDIMMHEAELMEQLLRGKNGKSIIPALDSEEID